MRGVGPRAAAGQRGRGLQQGTPRPRDGGAVPRDPAAAAGAVPRPRLRLRPDRAGDRDRRAAGERDRHRRQPAGAAARERERAVAPRGRPLHRLHPGAGAHRRDVRRDLVEPADPDRQGGAARPAARVAAAVASRRPRGDGGRQAPRRRLPATVADRPGLAHEPARECQGVPGAGDASAADGRTIRVGDPRRTRRCRTRRTAPGRAGPRTRREPRPPAPATESRRSRRPAPRRT